MGHELPPAVWDEVVDGHRVQRSSVRHRGKGHDERAVDGNQDRGAGRHRAGPLYLHVAGRRRRRHRAGRPGHRLEDHGTGRSPHWDILNRSRRSVAVNLKHPDGVALVLGSGGEGRRAGRGLAPRCGRAPRGRARALFRAQPPPRLRPHDGLGPRRPHGPDGRPRHQLHRLVRGVVVHRPGGGASGAAPQLGGGLRRRWHGARLRDDGGAACRRPARARARWSTPPWWTGRRPS